MKTKSIVIVLSIIIGSSIIFGVTFHLPIDDSIKTGFESPFREQHYEIEITGLEDVYQVGEKYSFSVIFSGYGTDCFSYDISFPVNSTDNMTIATMHSCVADAPIREFVQDLKKDHGRSFGHIILEELGEYTVQVSMDKGSFGSTVAEQTFLVVEKNCNDVDGKKELECFADAFESCDATMINYIIYTIEGDPMYLEGYVEGDDECYMRIVFDNTQDKFGGDSVGIFQTQCSSIEFTKHTMNISDCDDDFDYQLNYQSPDWASDEKCRTIGGKWNYEFHNCVDVPDVEFSCENKGGTLACMSDEQKGHGRDVCQLVCEFEVMDKK